MDAFQDTEDVDTELLAMSDGESLSPLVLALTFMTLSTFF